MSACNLCLQQHGIVSRYLVKNIFDAYLCANEFYRAFYLAYRIATLLSKTGGYYQPWVDCVANIINPCNQIIEGSQNLEYLRGYLASFWDGEHWNDYQFCKTPSEIYNECRFVVNAYRLLKCWKEKIYGFEIGRRSLLRPLLSKRRPEKDLRKVNHHPRGCGFVYAGLKVHIRCAAIWISPPPARPSSMKTIV